MRWKRTYVQSMRESGYSLLELMIAVPVMIMVSLGMFNIFAIAGRHYADFLGNWELVQQVRVPMEELGRDIRYCGEMKLEKASAEDYTLYIRRHYLRESEAEQEDYWQKYRVRRGSDGSYWITKNTQPLIGATALSDVYLERCNIQLLDYRRVRADIIGMNRSTGHRFRLNRIFYSYGYGIEPVKEGEG